MYCEHCGSATGSESKFCSACGSEIQVSGNSQRTSQRRLAGARGRSSAQKLQAILLISIPALLLVIIVAWLIIPSAFQNTTMRGRQPDEQSAPKVNTRSADTLSPSDSEVRRILDRHFNKLGYHVILIGDAAVTTGANNFDRKEISADEFKEVVAWSQAGLIDLARDDVLSNSERFKGHLKRIKVTPTAKGLQFQKDSNIREPLDPKFLYARFITLTASDIIENREVKKNVDSYRVVKGTYKIHWNEVSTKVYSALGWPMTAEWKFIILLKYDPFKKEWDLVAWDSTPAGGQFQSSLVERYLAEH